MNFGSTKQCEELESTSALKLIKAGKRVVVTERNKASGLKGADALRRTSVIARLGSTQPMVRAESKRLLSIFSSPQPEFFLACRTSLLPSGLWLSQQRMRILDNLLRCVLHLHRKDRGCW